MVRAIAHNPKQEQRSLAHDLFDFVPGMRAMMQSSVELSSRMPGYEHFSYLLCTRARIWRENVPGNKVLF